MVKALDKHEPEVRVEIEISFSFGFEGDIYEVPHYGK
jgi:hypothetical protein